MARLKYLVKWNYASSKGVYMVEDVVELDASLAEEINRDSPGVLVEEKNNHHGGTENTEKNSGEEEDLTPNPFPDPLQGAEAAGKGEEKRDRMVREPKKRRGG